MKIAPCLFLGLAAPTAWASGPGLPNESHNARFEVLSEYRSAIQAPRGQGFVMMHDGYLFVPFSADGGGGGGTGGFTFYDISNPRAPSVASTTVGKAPYEQLSGANYAGDFREPHGYTFSENVLCMTMNDTGDNRAGLQFWDFSDIDGSRPGSPDAPLRLSEISLGSLSGADYDNTAWWVAWQEGRYAYVAGFNAGLFIVDATDPANPVELKRVPTGELGGFRVNVVHVLGNLMVLANSDTGSGIATLDISDPLNPQVLDTETSLSAGYSIQLNDNRVFIASDPARVLDIADPADITLEAAGPNVASRGGYGVFKDGRFVYGSSDRMVDLDVSSIPYTSLGTFRPPGFNAPDRDFATVLGNMVFMGNDHVGSALVALDTAPDTEPPEVTMVSPADGAGDQARTSRIGLAFSDMLDKATLDTNNIQVRPTGGAPLPGRFSHQTGVVNFWPDEEMEPGTTYEVVVPAGGVRDVAGNAFASTWTSTFTTAGNPADFKVDLASSGPAEPGEAVTFTVTSDEPGLQ